ncbi:MAG: gliding motility protein GldM [Bacteroidales bacterium]|jgi:gliding motility-associated protein GldM|nr:gliding motility protein GldM [Bacteroidales bacterium]
MGHGKETPRQKMIGMMYLVLTSMLALNVSKDILDSFVLVDEGLFKTTTNFAAKNESIYAAFAKQKANSPDKVAPWEDKALEVRMRADRLVEDMQQLKIEIVKKADGDDAKALQDTVRHLWDNKAKNFEDVPSANIKDDLINGKDNTDIPAEIMIVKKKGEELKTKIEQFRDYVLTLVSDNHPEIKAAVTESLNTSAKIMAEETSPWEVTYFEHLPLIAVLTNLTKFQSDVRNVEAEVTQHLLSAIDEGALRVNKVEAIVISPSNYILQGGQYEAQVILAALDTLQKPDVVVGNYTTKTLPDGSVDYEMASGSQTLTYDAKGRAVYRVPANTVGNFKWGGVLRQMNPDGTYTKRPFTAEYQVGKADAVISATKMNVFYVGVDNPVSISASGIPADKISASMTNGSLVRSGSTWVARPTKAGADAIVTVIANIDGQNKKMGEQLYRVKNVPDPVAKVAGKTGGKIDKATLVAQIAVVPELAGFDFDMKFRVVSFTVNALVKTFNVSKPSNSATINAEQKALINGLTKGGKVYFEDIKVIGPDGMTRELPAIAFTLN